MIPTADMVNEFLDRLEKQNYSKEYIDGTLEGMSYVLEFYKMMESLHRNKERYIRQEHATRKEEGR